MKQFECNVEEVFNSFSQLASADMKKSIKGAISKAAKVLQEQTKTNLNSVIKTRGNNHWRNGELIEYSDIIDDGVRRTKVYENSDEDYEAKVHILGTRASESGTYRLRFLETGTKERYAKHYRHKGDLMTLKKPRNLGMIRGRRFFEAAKREVLPQIQQIYLEEINKSIQRINNS